MAAIGIRFVPLALAVAALTGPMSSRAFGLETADLASSTKAAEIKVTIDDTLLAGEPLAKELAAEGKRWIAARRAEADKAWETSPELFGTGQRWRFERDYASQSVVGRRYISVLRTDFARTGGGPATAFTCGAIVWDNVSRRRINIGMFFKETANGGPTMKAMLAAVLAALNAGGRLQEAAGSPIPNWTKAIEPKLSRIGAATLAPSTLPERSAGLVFHYSARALGRPGDGELRAFVPWQSLRPYLSAEGEAIFGGEPPLRDSAL